MTTATARTAYRSNRRRRNQRELQGIDGLTDGHTVAAHIQTCLNAGWTRLGIAAASHVSDRAIRYILAGQPKVQRDNALRLLAIQPHHSPCVPALGIIRRIRALCRAGYPIRWTAQQASCSNRHIYEILNGTAPLVDRGLAERFADVYHRHETRPGPSSPSRIAATNKEWPGPEAWDPDTIDDPNGKPEWTGHCGTDRGWWMHKQQQLPMCQRCEQAHADWLAAHRHLPPSERFRALGIARGEASGRGAALADDARELMRISGLTHDQAAERLGITRQHLHQELCRHPEPAEAAA